MKASKKKNTDNLKIRNSDVQEIHLSDSDFFKDEDNENTRKNRNKNYCYKNQNILVNSTDTNRQQNSIDIYKNQ